MNPSRVSQDLIDSQDIVQHTEEDRGCLALWKKRSYIKVKNLSLYDVYLRVYHTEDCKDFKFESKKGISASGPGFNGSVGLGSKHSTRSRSRNKIVYSYPGVIRARQNGVAKAKKRRIFPTVVGNIRTALSAYVVFDKKLDYRDVKKEDKGRLYLFENVYCGPGYIRNIKTEHVNAVREEFRRHMPAAVDNYRPTKKMKTDSESSASHRGKKNKRRNDKVVVDDDAICTSSLEADIEEFRKRYFSNLHVDSPPDYDIEDAMDIASVDPDEDSDYASDEEDEGCLMDYNVADDDSDEKEDVATATVSVRQKRVLALRSRDVSR